MRTSRVVLIIGDLAVAGLVTLAGFASHGDLQEAGWRMLTTFLPLVFAWGLVAIPGGLYSFPQVYRADQLWRPVWGAFIAGPLAALLRSLFLNLRPVLPVFALVITGVSALAFTAWRFIFYMLYRGRGNWQS